MSLIGWWKLDGDANDSSKYANHGTVSGPTVDTTEALLGQSYKFDVSTERIKIEKDDFTELISNKMSVSLRIKITAAIPVTGWILSKQGAFVAYNFGFVVLISATGPTFYVRFGNGSTFTQTTYAFSTDIWYHLVATYENGTSKLYINGVYQMQHTVAIGGSNIDWTGISNFTIGNHHTTNIGVGGSVDSFMNDVRIYDHVLSLKEIKELSRCKIFHLNFNYDTYQSVEEYNRFKPASVDSSLVHDTTNQRRGIGCLDATGGNGTGIVYGTPDILKVNANCSFTFWMYYTTTNNTSIWKKANAGEGELITYGIFRGIYLQFGELGTDHFLFKTLALSDLPFYDLNTWTHVGIVRDDDNEEVVFYKNGSWFSTHAATPWLHATGGTQDFKIAGDGFTSMDGLIDDFRIYHTLLSADDMAEIYKNRGSADNRGNFWC